MKALLIILFRIRFHIALQFVILIDTWSLILEFNSTSWPTNIFWLSKIWNISSEGKMKREQDGSRNEGRGEKVGMVNEVECWQRIISMTSKGVVISRCFSPSLPRTASGEPPPRDCINSSRSLRPGFPFTPHSPFCSTSSSHLTLPLLGPRVDVTPPEAQLPGTNEACRRRV